MSKEITESPDVKVVPITSEIKRGPGRPPRQEAVKKSRRRREGLGLDRNLRLHVPEGVKDPNFHYHWINDNPGRILNKTVQDDYDIVTEEDLRGEKLGEGEGTQVKRAVGTGPDGGWKYAYLCRKPKDFYKEDQKTEQAEIDAKMKAIKQGSQEGLGKEDHSYVPKGHQNVVE